MWQVQAIRHQGHPIYSSHGRQCMANSAVAAIKSLESDVREKSISVLDDILHKGDRGNFSNHDLHVQI